MQEFGGIPRMAFMFYCVERCTGDEEGLAQTPIKSAGQEREDSNHSLSEPLFSLLFNYYCLLKMIKKANLDVINTLNLALHKTDSFMKGQSPFS